jgi:hypothetical protein
MVKMVTHAKIFKTLGQLALKLATRNGLAQKIDVPHKSISFMFRYPLPSN